MKTLKVVIVMALFAWCERSAHAQKPGVVVGNEPGWQEIGETVASFKSQNESIAVIGADEFSAIKLKIEDAPLIIERLQVFYESGEMEEIDVQKRIEEGNESDVFRLKHPDGDIQKVAFTYNTVANAQGDKAEVKLFGLNPDEDKSSEAYRDDEETAEEKVEDAGDNIERESEKAERKADKAEDDIDEHAEHTESDIERAADETGDAISETAAKAAAEIDDPRHDTKVGPDGQSIYIGDDSRYYYINDEGKRVYVRESQLKDKPEKE